MNNFCMASILLMSSAKKNVKYWKEKKHIYVLLAWQWIQILMAKILQLKYILQKPN